MTKQCPMCGQEWPAAEPAAQQPEAPPAELDDATRERIAKPILDAWYDESDHCGFRHHLQTAIDATWREAAERIRELEAENARLADAAEYWLRDRNSHWDQLNASRERERAAVQALRMIADHPRESPVPTLIVRFQRIAREAIKRLATPDSAASPTGGER